MHINRYALSTGVITKSIVKTTAMIINGYTYEQLYLLGGFSEVKRK